MSQTTQLFERYRQQLQLPQNPYLSPAERIWIAVHDPAEERRIRGNIREFALVTQQQNLEWSHFDLTPHFARWMLEHPYHEAYFAEPELLKGALQGFENVLLDALQAEMARLSPQSVLAVTGAGTLYGLTRISTVIERAAPSLRGRMLLFFPGSLEGHNYRLLNARDGWNYHSVPLLP
ncbi:BREX protein BrxB domain-containing protein [Deinococcus fonticola]|uniref:BREX protein BrxB domain-containing protein n=1 Tax=Deinococcus fonticola TaxID=2528713 RepID=UPI00107530F8|nr:BREX protein BrxB domain-containing protein [Deinococcus fonticola]